MVRAYTEERFPLYAGPGVHDVVASIVRVIDAARDAGIPIAYTGVRIAPDGRDAGIFFRKVPALSVFIGDSEGGRLVPEIEPREDETVILKLQNPSAPAVVGATQTHTFTITDDDLATVAFSLAASATANEAAGNFPVTVKLTTTGASTLAAALTVNVNNTGGTATAGADYTAVAATV